MAAITATGVGSGMDLSSLVDSLVAADRAPQELRISRQESGAKAKLSALGTVTSALDSLQRTLATLKSGSAFNARTATSSKPDVFTASAASDAAIGSYDIEVLSLASAHKLVSNAFAADQALGAGSLRIAMGDKTLDVTIAAGEDTPAMVAAAIQKAADRAGIELNASAVTADDGIHLVFSAGEAGAGNAIRITRSSGAASLDALAYDPGNLVCLIEKVPATDAQVRVDGLLRTASGNTVPDLVPGLSLTLKQAAPGEIHTLAVAGDGNAARSAMQAFVNAYNVAVASIATTTKYDASTKVAAALNGDGMVRSAAGQMRNALGAALSAAGELGVGAGQLGITTKTDGSLVFDGAKFDATLAANPAAVTKALGGEGLAASLDKVLTGLLGSEGALRARSAQLNNLVTDAGKQRDRLDTRMADVEKRYRAQYAALDSLVAQLQNTGSFLSQQLASL